MPAQLLAAAVGAKMFDGYMGQVRDAQQYRRQKKLNEENNAFNAAEAEKQRAVARQLQTQQENYNSEQAQVSRLRQAGLNPALLYGGLTSSSGIASSSAASASPSSYTPTSQQPMMSDALAMSQDLELQKAQIENLRTNTASQGEDVFSKNTTNKYIDAKSNIENLKMLQELQNLKTQGALSESELKWFDKIKQSTLDSIIQNIEQSKTQSALNQAKTMTEGTVQNLNDAKTKTEGTVQGLNRAKTKTEGTVQGLNEAKTTTELFDQVLKDSQKRVNNITEKEIQLRYDIDKDEANLFEKFCDKLGIDKGFRKGLLNLYGEFSKSVGKGLGNFFDGNNWIKFWSDRYRTDTWSQSRNGEESSPSQTPTQTPSSDKPPQQKPVDAVQTVPSDEAFMKSIQQELPNTPENEQPRKAYNWIAQHYKELDKEQQQQLKKDLYYAKTHDEFLQKLYYWGYMLKYK